MHSLKRIAHLQETDDPVGERLDHGDLEPEPEIPDFGAERFAFIEQGRGPYRQRMQAFQQRGRRLALPEFLDGGTRERQRIARQIYPVEVPTLPQSCR